MPPARSPSGRRFEISHGSQHAVITEVGAGLQTYSTAGVDVIDGYGPEEMCTGGRGQLLLPWPNRIRDGRYRFDGESLQLPLSEPELGNAIHGLSRWMPWTVGPATASRVALALELPAQPGYPFTLSLLAEYRLGAEGLAVRVRARNDGTQPCPYGSGAHPYIRVSPAVVDEWLLCIPADVTMESDERSIPTGRLIPVDGTEFDFREPRPVGATRLDTAYTLLHPDQHGTTRVSVASSNRDVVVNMWMDATHAFVMAYTGDTLADTVRRRHGLGIEPMTCAPDAFNSGSGLTVLQPGQEHVSEWGISPGA